MKILLDCFIEKLFTAKSFDHDHTLVSNIDGAGKNLCVPEGVRREQFVQWVESIHELQSPYWLGLPNNAEKLLLTTRGRYIYLNYILLYNNRFMHIYAYESNTHYCEIKTKQCVHKKTFNVAEPSNCHCVYWVTNLCCI